MRWDVAEPGPVQYFARAHTAAGVWQVEKGPRESRYAALWRPSRATGTQFVFIAWRSTARGAQLAAQAFARQMLRDFKAFAKEPK